MKGNIAVDVHDTIANYWQGMIRWYGPHSGKYGSLEAGWPEVDMEEHFRTENHNEFLAELEPIQGASEVLSVLWLFGYEIFYVTAANHGNSGVTKRWLEYHDFPQADRVITTQGNLGKKRYFSRQPDGFFILAIDDHPEIIKHLVKIREESNHRLPRVVVFDREYNRGPERFFFHNEKIRIEDGRLKRWSLEDFIKKDLLP